MEPNGVEQHHRRGIRRLRLIVASLLPFVATMSFLWFGSADAQPASRAEPVDVARIVCRGGTTVVETPIVRAQRDGIHLLVESDVQGLAFSVNDGGWELGWGPAQGDSMYPFQTTQWLPPGVAEVQCGTMKATDGDTFEVIDPDELWHDVNLACIESGDFDERGSFPFYVDVNPMPEAIARAIPGVRPTDVIDYYGYPQPPWEQASESYRIVRDGNVVGSTEISSYGDRTFASVYSCDDSGIGITGEPMARQLATPFALPDLPRCDPYMADCSIVYLTATRYAAMRAEDPERYAVPEAPWAACLDTQPEGCPRDPDDIVLQILLAPRDAETFVSEHGCGASETTPCR